LVISHFKFRRIPGRYFIYWWSRRRSKINKFSLANERGRKNLGELVVDANNEGMCLEKLGMWA
jgi:hypothetical protein